MLSLSEVIRLIIFILPAYFANAAPTAFRTGVIETPMDFKMKFWDSRRILGEGKTWSGFFIGICIGTLSGFVLEYFGLWEWEIEAAFLLSLGAMVGDSVGSFLKRRLRFGRGKPFYIVDQLSFLVFALAFSSPFWPKALDWSGFLLLAFVTVILHLVTNIIAYKIGLKKVPW